MNGFQCLDLILDLRSNPDTIFLVIATGIGIGIGCGVPSTADSDARRPLIVGSFRGGGQQ
jgi:hypothetical protein